CTSGPEFFLQAEDGIRDFHVTGVQTCALPICPFYPPASEDTGYLACRISINDARWDSAKIAFCFLPSSTPFAVNSAPTKPAREEIGRASCRESAWRSALAVR